MEDTAVFIMEELCRLQREGSVKEREAVRTEIVYEAMVLFGRPFNDVDGPAERLFGQPETADAFVRLQDRARRDDKAGQHTIARYGELCILLCHLFIDKHKITKMNKRALYAVVLFLKNIVSGSLRLQYAFVIAYIPYPSSLTDAGEKIPDSVMPSLRRLSAHQTIGTVIEKLRRRKVYTLLCPDGKKRRFLVSIGNAVLDSPELRLQAG